MKCVKYIVILKNSLLALYVYYMLNIFKTTYYLHHPLEIWIQKKSMSYYLLHPLNNNEYSSKVCSLGNLVGKILAIYILGRYILAKNIETKITRILWASILLISGLMNLNVFIYLFPAYLIDSLLIPY